MSKFTKHRAWRHDRGRCPIEGCRRHVRSKTRHVARLHRRWLIRWNLNRIMLGKPIIAKNVIHPEEEQL